MWIGGTDEAQEGSWTWSDGSPWDYQKWGSGEPNNAGGSEDCSMMWPNGWNDVPCEYIPTAVPNQDTGFICSYSLADSYILLVGGTTKILQSWAPSSTLLPKTSTPVGMGSRTALVEGSLYSCGGGADEWKSSPECFTATPEQTTWTRIPSLNVR